MRPRELEGRPPLRAAFSALLLLAGCFSTPATEKYFYDLNLPSLLAQGTGVKRLAVAELSASPGYDGDEIAYRVSDNELRYYGYRRWIAEPKKLLTNAVVRHLRASKRFGQVDLEERVPRAEALLDGHVEAIEELDDGKVTRAHLAMSFVLRTAEGGEIVLRYAFDETLLCERRHPQEIARKVSRILAVQMPILAHRIARALP